MTDVQLRRAAHVMYENRCSFGRLEWRFSWAEWDTLRQYAAGSENRWSRRTARRTLIRCRRLLRAACATE